MEMGFPPTIYQQWEHWKLSVMLSMNTVTKTAEHLRGLWVWQLGCVLGDIPSPSPFKCFPVSHTVHFSFAGFGFLQELNLKVLSLLYSICWLQERTKFVVCVRPFIVKTCQIWWILWQPSLCLQLLYTSRFVTFHCFILMAWAFHYDCES